MIKKILFWLFPGTINEIINDAMTEAGIIYWYGSMEAYHESLQRYAEDPSYEEEMFTENEESPI